ncbi:MAG TPA: AarF/UbiB family protein [Candidatus Paceibacterota bacterium]|nr:AarF/UbiB family protein [Candidatus Paceibacterota bacterium]
MSSFVSDRTHLEHGEISHDHPAYRYVEEIFNRLPRDEGQDLKLRVIPHTHNVNAFALPDGSIGIFTPAIEFAESREAVEGILAHEKVHVEQEHGKKKQKLHESARGDVRSGVEVRLAALAQSRLAEYQADISATMHQMDKAGTNPLGYKLFLLKMAEKEHVHDRYGDVHGRSLDRALNVATGSYLMDLRSLSGNLTPVPPEIIESVKDEKPPATKAIFSRPGDYSGFIKPVAERRRERREGLACLSQPTDYLIALSALHNATDGRRKKMDEDDAECMKLVVGELDKHLENGIGPASRMAKAVVMSYFSGTSVEVAHDMLSEDTEKKPLRMTDVRDYMRKAAESGVFSYALAYTRDYSKDVINFLIKKNLLREGEDNIAEILDESLVKLDDAYSMDVAQPGTFKEMYTKITKKQEETDEEKKKTKAPKTSRTKEDIWAKVDISEANYDPTILGICKKYINHREGIFMYQAIPPISQELIPLLYDLEPDEVFKKVRDLYWILGAIGTNFTEMQGLKQVHEQTEATINAYVPDFALHQILNQCLNELPCFKKNPALIPLYKTLLFHKTEMNVIRAVAKEVRDHMSMDDEMQQSWVHTQQERDAYDGNEDLDLILEELEGKNNYAGPPEIIISPEERRMSSEMIVDIEGREIKNAETELSKNLSEKRLQKMYQFFVDQEYQRDHNLEFRHSAISDRPQEVLKELFARNFDLFTANISLTQIADLIDRFQEKFNDFASCLEENRKVLGNIVSKVADACEDGSLWKLSLSQIILISKFVDNPFLRVEISSRAVSTYWDQLSFEEKLEMLFSAKADIGISDLSLRERFLCEEVNTKARYEQVKDLVANSFDEIFANPSAKAGGLVIIDRLSFRYADPITFLKAALTTSDDDRSLRLWVDDFFVGTRTNSSEVVEEDDEDVPLSREETETRQLRRVSIETRATDRALHHLYSLDAVGRRLLVRKLLVGESGLLFSEKNKRAFFDTIFDTWVESDSSQADLKKALDNIKEALIEEPSWEVIYFAMQGVLADKMFIPSEDINDDKAKIAEEGEFAQEIKALNGELRMRHKLIGEKEAKTRKQKISPIEFIKEVGGNLGALGRRFLQVLPQFVRLPEKYEAEFSDVYDRVAGQSKFAALATVEREWPEVWDEFTEIKDRVGGGSIVTVFEAQNKNGKAEVLKVRNPNILWHLDEAEKVAGSIATRLSDQHGGAYTQAKGMIPDISMWVSGDVRFGGFLEKDKDFRSKYTGFNAPNNPYSIRVPESYGPASEYFSREEYIPGTNLTSLDTLIGSPSHDARKVISLLARFYGKQLQEGRLHSDVHPGNYSVTDNKELVVYDRNYYIDLTDQEKSAILSLFNPFAPMPQKSERLRELMNANEDQVPVISAFIGSLGSGNVDQAKRDLVAIKAAGVKVPLNLTLILKNVSSINSLAQKVGFKNVFEAMMA